MVKKIEVQDHLDKRKKVGTKPSYLIKFNVYLDQLLIYVMKSKHS